MPATLDVTLYTDPGCPWAYSALPNVVLTPHIASAGRLTRRRMAHLAVDNLLAMADGRTPPSPVVP